MNIINIIITVASSSIVTFFLSIAAFKYDLIKIKATTSSEVSKSEQEKMVTADKAIDLVNKLQGTMDKQFEEMQSEITKLRSELNQYINQCSTCSNNKIRK
jgi:TolA-binding protein